MLLDGTWSQAKALWWRNAWMLKCQRVILGPAHPSRYGKLRREPRRDGLSTIEAAAMLLSASKSGPILPRRCTRASSECWRNTARRRRCCRDWRPNRGRSAITVAVSGPEGRWLPVDGPRASKMPAHRGSGDTEMERKSGAYIGAAASDERMERL